MSFELYKNTNLSLSSDYIIERFISNKQYIKVMKEKPFDLLTIIGACEYTQLDKEKSRRPYVESILSMCKDFGIKVIERPESCINLSSMNYLEIDIPTFFDDGYYIQPESPTFLMVDIVFSPKAIVSTSILFQILLKELKILKF